MTANDTSPLRPAAHRRASWRWAKVGAIGSAAERAPGAAAPSAPAAPAAGAAIERERSRAGEPQRAPLGHGAETYRAVASFPAVGQGR